MTWRPTLDLAGMFLLTATLGSPAAAQVYRCEEGGTTVFSDVPCSESAEVLDLRTGISVVAAADDLEDVARRNKSFIEQRREKLAARRERVAQRARQANRDEQRRTAAEEIRYRTIIGPAADSRFRGQARTQPDPRTQAQRQQGAVEDLPERRRTLLSRSGGNQPRILR